jgi:acid phosphatase (class A)
MDMWFHKPMPPGFEQLHPGGIAEDSPAFQRWDRDRASASPAGTAEPSVFLSSLRDSSWTASTLGYVRQSLRDKTGSLVSQILVAFPRPAVLAAIFALTCSVAFAKESSRNYLKGGKLEAATLLAPPPLPDSPEQAADMQTVRAVYHAASKNDIAAAHSEKSFSVFNFTTEVGAYFQSNNLPKTATFFKRIQTDASTVTDAQKDFFMRPRPYTVDTNLASGKLETSFSYPSGHSTESMVLALVLADLVPDKRDAILAHARSIGWHRVQIARHYPTDIYAGRVLAQAIVRQIEKSEAFKKDFEEARDELTSWKN